MDQVNNKAVAINNAASFVVTPWPEYDKDHDFVYINITKGSKFLHMIHVTTRFRQFFICEMHQTFSCAVLNTVQARVQVQA